MVSAFSKSWTDPRRGTLPISWAIDPQLGAEFPALFDYFSQTAGVNDSFISGPGGCGYVYYGRMTDPQIDSFATRCGSLMKDYGPAVIDTFGQTSAVSNAGADSPNDRCPAVLLEVRSCGWRGPADVHLTAHWQHQVRLPQVR